MATLEPDGSLKWAYAKKRLLFCVVKQDGDGEGALVMDRLPTAAEAELIRDVFGIFRARRMPPPTEAQLAVREEFARRRKEEARHGEDQQS